MISLLASGTNGHEGSAGCPEMMPGPHECAADETLQSPEAPEPLLIGSNMQCARGQGKKDRKFPGRFPPILRAFNV
ncbi:MAG: hypothetical protein U0942_15635 [Parvibaculum sp.]|jgi:hypothetical protein|uniref:hypothetical protein n=1 Tax=Parvibaculum sp. TaxID=2024848 RepID=UPI000CBD2F52|nr:hypothetical protein [Parvibaculum sp.]MDZ4382763.1 hypothetical protein [Parvibaculum sp.]PKP78276.1 MAG: hypothetical protein CVT81_04850 [Alphaproteobacteria bacterium HGW-Alphaproteobacteria-3]